MTGRRLKTCPKCLRTMWRADFGVCAATKDGRQVWCPECKRGHDRRSRALLAAQTPSRPRLSAEERTRAAVAVLRAQTLEALGR